MSALTPAQTGILIFFLFLAVSGIVAGVLSSKKNGPPTPGNTEPKKEDTPAETKTTVVSRLRKKISGFRLSHLLMGIGLVVVCMFVIGMVSAPFRDKPAPIEDGPSHTLPQLRAGETYTNAQFCKGYGRTHQVEFLDQRFDFQNTDVIIVVPGTGGNHVEFRYNGKSLFDESGIDTGYTLSNLPDGDCFMLKIGGRGKGLIPSNSIRVTSTLNDYEKKK